MTAERHDSERESVESETRIWQIYADQIGIPDTASTPTEEPLPQPTEPLTTRRSALAATAKSVGLVLLAIAVGLVAAKVGTGLLSGSRPSSDTASRRSPTAASERVAELAPRAEKTPPAIPAASSSAPSPSAPLTSGVAAPVPAAAVPVPAPPAAAPAVVVAAPTDRLPTPSVAERSEATQTARRPPAETKPESTNVTYRINFDFASDYITDESKLILNQVVAVMKANPQSRMSIAGHTDAMGTPELNRDLSERRARAVRMHLESAGIAPGRLSAAGYGASRPVAPNEGQWKFLNRRVEIRGL